MRLWPAAALILLAGCGFPFYAPPCPDVGPYAHWDEPQLYQAAWFSAQTKNDPDLQIRYREPSSGSPPLRTFDLDERWGPGYHLQRLAWTPEALLQVGGQLELFPDITASKQDFVKLSLDREGPRDVIEEQVDLFLEKLTMGTSEQVAAWRDTLLGSKVMAGCIPGRPCPPSPPQFHLYADLPLRFDGFYKDHAPWEFPTVPPTGPPPGQSGEARAVTQEFNLTFALPSREVVATIQGVIWRLVLWADDHVLLVSIPRNSESSSTSSQSSPTVDNLKATAQWFGERLQARPLVFANYQADAGQVPSQCSRYY